MDGDGHTIQDVDIHNKSRLSVLFILAFFFSVNMALTSYINSSFLEQFASPKVLGLIYMAGSALTLFILLKLPFILTKIGNYKMILGFIALSIISLSFFSFFGSTLWVIIFFIIYMMTNSIIYASLDEFVEYYSKVSKVGSIRGVYFTIQNIGWIASPFLAGVLVETIGFRVPYTVALVAMIIMFFGVLFWLHTYRDPKYFEHVRFKRLISDVKKYPGVYGSYWVNVILNFFYAWMIVYAPIYLHETIGFGWETIGIMFTVMLVPFIVLQFPLGRLADKYIGEKEIMITGLCIMAVSVVGVGLLNSTNPIIWGALLFLTRIGASATEIAIETYFFKQVTPTDTGFLGFYRSAHPVSYILGTLVASLLLLIMPMQYIFFVLAFIILIGVYFASKLIDTK